MDERFSNPLFWAVLIGWVLSVVLHEFAHGIVAYWGGDYTIRERGGLTLNPLQYIDPFISIVLPIIFVLIGGVPKDSLIPLKPGPARNPHIDSIRGQR